jgi:hypothetical protein
MAGRDSPVVLTSSLTDAPAPAEPPDRRVEMSILLPSRLKPPSRHPPFAGRFDAVLVDAPCSGLGTLRRHPELRWRRRADDIPRLAALQREILGGVAPLVRPGGVLVCAVCTLAREENEGVLECTCPPYPRCSARESAAARMQQPPWLDADRPGEPLDVQETDVAFAALD